MNDQAKTVTEFIPAMAFYHQDGFVPSFKQAEKFAGKDGRVGVLPDVISARINSGMESSEWNQYYTTMSAEYCGLGKSGRKIIIVAHGVGPMSTLEGVMKAYKHHYADKSRRTVGGRIAQQEFLDLEAGKYGPVAIVDLESYIAKYEYPFISVLNAKDLYHDPLFKARVGEQWQEYWVACFANAIKWREEYKAANMGNPYMIEIHDNSNCSYQYYRFEDGLPIAHLLSIGGLVNCSHQDHAMKYIKSLVHDIGVHGWYDGTRMLGVRNCGVEAKIHKGPDTGNLKRKHWKRLFKPCDLRLPVKPDGLFFALSQIDDQWFTRYNDDGQPASDPQFKVISISELGEEKTFYTDIGGYHGIFRYDSKDVRRIAPLGANAFAFTSNPEILWKGGSPEQHYAKVQFFRVEVDLSQELIREKELRDNFDLMMELVQVN